MSFVAVAVYDLDGKFQGYSIKKIGATKLHTMNLWQDTADDLADLNQQLAALKDSVDIYKYWPDMRDPDVEKLLDDPTFEPVAVVAQEVVDEENSVFVFGEEDPLTLIRPLIEEESNIVTKIIEVPSPAEVGLRIRKACEIVARARAEEASQNA